MIQIDLLPPKERRSAVFSDDRVYRYTLEIVWEPTKQRVQFIGLNPSTADEQKDDPTIRKCKQFAKNWGFGGMVMTNLFSYRDTDPRGMKRHPQPIGEKCDKFPSGELNDYHLTNIWSNSGATVAAWGNHGAHLDRWKSVLTFMPDMKCFRITGAGQPEHPLYMPYTQPLIDYVPHTQKRCRSSAD